MCKMMVDLTTNPVSSVIAIKNKGLLAVKLLNTVLQHISFYSKVQYIRFTLNSINIQTNLEIVGALHLEVGCQIYPWEDIIPADITIYK